MARAGRACWPATRGAELSTSIARGRRTAETAGLDDEAAGRAGSGRRRGLGCGQRRDAAGRMARPGGGRRRRRRGRDELDVRPGGAGATEARSKMAVAAARIDV